MAQFDNLLEEARTTHPYHLQTVRVRVPRVEDLGETMSKIRTWLDRQKVQTASFRTTADPSGHLLTIGFASEENAKRFRKQFRGADGSA